MNNAFFYMEIFRLKMLIYLEIRLVIDGNDVRPFHVLEKSDLPCKMMN